MSKMTDVKKLITEHLDIWLTAETEKKSGRGRSSGSSNSIYGVQKLRELILDLAFKGKLSNRNSLESSQLLIKELNEFKQKLIDKGVIKKSKKLSIEEKYIIPSSWTWLTLQDYLDVRDGTHDTPKYIEKGYPLITSKNISSGKLDFTDVKYISKKDHESISIRSKVEFGDILFAMIGSIGNPVLVDTYQEFSVKNVALFKPYQREITNIRYVLKYLIYITDHLKANAQGAVQSFVSLNVLRNTPIPIPPLDEQQRIVTKVDELMQLCDQLEQQQNLSSEAHDQLVDTFLSVLTNSTDVDEFQQNWQRISENFDLLFTTVYSIEQLKQTILQLAVIGKLVKQNPNDEPANELLKQIAEEKARLVKEGKIKKSKLLPNISEEEKPHEIPHNWKWVYLNNIAYVGTGATPSRTNPEYWNPKDLNWLSSGETANDFVEKTNEMVSELALKETNLTVYPVGSLIVAMYGQGKTRGQITELNIPAATNQACAGIIPVLEAVENRRYIKLFFQKIYDEIREIAEGGAQPNLNLNKIQQTKIPLPPINEQKRIVAKVEQLFSFIEQLKELQGKLQSTKLYLANSFVRNALSDSNYKSKSEATDNIIQFEKPIEAIKQSNQKSSDQIDLFADESVEDDIKLLSLAAEITFQLHTEPTFGHLKLQKLIYLCQQLKHMDLAADFKQHAAGPYDPVMARYLDQQFKDREWFSYDSKRDLKYKPLSKCNDHRSAFNKYFAKDVTAIYDLIGLFRTSKSDHIEIVATLFACWLRLLEKKLPVTEEQLMKDFYAWSEEKNRFGKNEVLNGYRWMKQNSVLPL